MTTATCPLQSPVFVSAIYPLCEESRVQRMFERFRLLSTFFHVHLFCPPTFSPPDLENTTLHHIAFEELDTFKILQKTTGLPRIRCTIKDTRDFMILMNAKTEFIRRLQDAGVAASHYIWIDAGIGQIFKDPAASYKSLCERLTSNTLPTDSILIPGCTAPETRFDVLLTKVCWRFCGGFFVVPAAFVTAFATTVLDACEEIWVKSGLAIWEVNVWAFVEARLPIQWARGDHNESIFNCI